MKKIICAICILALSFSTVSISAFASTEPESGLVYINSNEALEVVEGIYNTNSNTRATGLITQKTLNLSKTSSTQMKITAITKGSEDVTKCGFTYIKLQRLVNGFWTDYTTYCYYDQYDDSTSKTFTQYISPPTGYSYRVVCEHYAEKKTLLIFTSDETSYNETSSLSF